MKKIFLALIVLLLLVVIGIYALLPATQKSESSFTVKANQKALYRALLEQTVVYQKNNPQPAQTSLVPASLQLYPGVFDEFILVWQQADKPYNSQLKLLPLNVDSTVLYWNGIITGGNTPWSRVSNYLRMRKMQQQATQLISNLKPLEEQERLYGFVVRPERVTDSVMVSVKFKTATYPQTAEIYQHIGLLQSYITAAGAKPTNYPMLHVTNTANGYESQVAIPTNKALPNNGNIELKRMVMGKMLASEIKGGQGKVEKAMQTFDNYITDRGFVSPAIPFASLVTDRTKETDSTKWITKLSYPIY